MTEDRDGWDQLWDELQPGGDGAARRVIDLVVRAMEDMTDPMPGPDGPDMAGTCFRDRFDAFTLAWEMSLEPQQQIQQGQRVAWWDRGKYRLRVGMVLPFPPEWQRLRALFPFTRKVRVWGEGCPPGGVDKWLHVASMVPISLASFVEARRAGGTVLPPMVAEAEVEAFMARYAVTADQEVQ